MTLLLPAQQLTVLGHKFCTRPRHKFKTISEETKNGRNQHVKKLGKNLGLKTSRAFSNKDFVRPESINGRQGSLESDQRHSVREIDGYQGLDRLETKIVGREIDR